MLTYENGIVLATDSKHKLVLSNQYGYIGYYYGYKCFRPTALRSIDDLNNLKSRLVDNGWEMDWLTFQWCLVNFDKIMEM
jgi:hypothetical protein